MNAKNSFICLYFIHDSLEVAQHLSFQFEITQCDIISYTMSCGSEPDSKGTT